MQIEVSIIIVVVDVVLLQLLAFLQHKWVDLQILEQHQLLHYFLLLLMPAFRSSVLLLQLFEVKVHLIAIIIRRWRVT